MIDKKPTDSEIIKALEVFVDSIGKDIIFANVDMKIDGINEFKHIDLSFNDIFDLINRLEAEKRSIKYDYDNLQRQFDEIYQQFHYLSNVEIPYLYSFIEDKEKKLETIANILLRTKAEAYKEFAERLNEELRMYGIKDKFNKSVFLNIADKVKKEMVGEDNA